jgi:hypothetical protein
MESATRSLHSHSHFLHLVLSEFFMILGTRRRQQTSYSTQHMAITKKQDGRQ